MKVHENSQSESNKQKRSDSVHSELPEEEVKEEAPAPKQENIEHSHCSSKESAKRSRVEEQGSDSEDDDSSDGSSDCSGD